MKQREFLFTVIMAVWQTKQYLTQAVHSLLRQSIGFAHIQLLLCDDGSTDGSAPLCDAFAATYPGNITVLHLPHGGVSAARNAGLPLAKGRYVNFMDSDDKMGLTALARVARFFARHPTLEVACLPVYYFGARHTPHPLNGKFSQGTRIIDLRTEPQQLLLQVTSTFFRRSAVQGLCFDEHLRLGEDCLFANSVLLRTLRLGVVCGSRYGYRDRGNGTSTLECATGHIEVYLPFIRRCLLALYTDGIRRFGTVIPYLQHLLFYCLQWRLAEQDHFSAGSKAAQPAEYRDACLSLLRCIDAHVITACRFLSPVLQSVALYEHAETPANGLAAFALCFLTPENGHLCLTATPVFGQEHSAEFSPCELYAEYNGTRIFAQPVPGPPPLSVLGGCCRYPRAGARFDFTPIRSSSTASIRFFWHGRPITRLCTDKFFPLSSRFSCGYYCCDGLLLQLDHDRLLVSTTRRTVGREAAFLKQLTAAGLWYAAGFRALSFFLRAIYRRDLWLLSDRIDRADDNGRAFFTFLRQHHREIPVIFCIGQHSADFPVLKKLGRVLPYHSCRQLMAVLLCSHIISSAAEEGVVLPFGPLAGDAFRDIMTDKKFIFLQHGIVKDDMSAWLNRYNKNIDGFVCCAIPEAVSLHAPAYAYPPDRIWLTGLARHDLLYHDDKKLITIMPTWRRYLQTEMSPCTGTRTPLPGFKQSAFFQFYDALLSNHSLLEAARFYGYTLCFFPHPSLRCAVDLFHLPPQIVCPAPQTSYRTLFAQSALMVTDYSSTAFDFALLQKPVLYMQFDSEAFFAGHTYRPGYFDYLHDGFGPVVRTQAEAICRMRDFMAGGCHMAAEYRRRVSRFFAFPLSPTSAKTPDWANCKRIFDRIIDSEKADPYEPTKNKKA